jgi:uncharacterized protein YndB with AHSA1/START domain
MKPNAALVLLGLVATGICLSAQFASPITTEGTVNAPIDEVWRAWTTKDGIESWMVAKTEIDLRVGAIWKTSYSKESNLNDDASIHHEILAYDPGRMLAFRTVKPPKGFPFAAALSKTWNVVYFEPLDASHTRITARMFGYEQDGESQQMRAFFEKGNKFTMDTFLKKFDGTRQERQ